MVKRECVCTMGLMIVMSLVAACSGAPSSDIGAIDDMRTVAAPAPGTPFDMSEDPDGPAEVTECRDPLMGDLYSLTTQSAIRGTIVYLTPGEGPDGALPPTIYTGAQVEQGDVPTTSDDQGSIVLCDVPPGTYFLVVWAPYDWLLVMESDTSGVPRHIEVQDGEPQDLGRLELYWP